MKDLHGGNVDRGHDISVPLVSLRAHLDSSYGGVGVALAVALAEATWALLRSEVLVNLNEVVFEY